MFFEFSSDKLNVVRSVLLNTRADDDRNKLSSDLSWLVNTITLGNVEHSQMTSIHPLLTLLLDLERMFVATPPDAPGYVYCGGVHIIDDGNVNLPPFSVTGLGTSPVNAMMRMAGELAEVISLCAVPSVDTNEGPDASELQFGLDDRFNDPLSHDRTDIDWHPARRIFDSKRVWIPKDICFFQPSSEDRRIPKVPISEGCGAGTDLQFAIVHAMFELLERDAYCLWWHGGVQAKQVDLGPLNSTKFDAFRWRIRRGNTTRKETILDITTDLAVPVVAALSWDESGCGLVCGTAAAETLAAAAASAYREMCQLEFGLELAKLKFQQVGAAGLSQKDRTMLDLAEKPIEAFSASIMPETQSVRRNGELCPNRLIDLSDLNLESLSKDLEFLKVEYKSRMNGLSVVKIISPILQPSTPEVLSKRLKVMQNLHQNTKEFAQRPPLL